MFSDIKILKVDKSKPLLISYKCSFDPNVEFNSFEILREPKRKKKKGGTQRTLDTSRVKLKTLYSCKLQISDQKKKHLRELLKGGQIPNVHKDFYSDICK